MKHPKMLVEGLNLLGTLEGKGTANNPTILSWAKEIGGKISDVYLADEIPWCGLFMAVCAKRAGFELPKDPLWALNWGTFGKRVEIPMRGDVLVFTRKGGGHVAMYYAEDDTHYHILGGNQDNAVNIRRRPKTSLYMARRPIWKVKQPKEVQRVFVSPKGGLVGSEQ